METDFKFKVGDRVRIIRNSTNTIEFSVGDVGTVLDKHRGFSDMVFVLFDRWKGSSHSLWSQGGLWTVENLALENGLDIMLKVSFGD